MTKAVDLSFVLDASTVDILAKNGITHVGRYLSHTSWKGLTVAEVAAIKKAGLDIFSFYETNPTKVSYFTADKGKSDALAAIALAKSVGQPAGTAIYFTVDFDCPPSAYGAVDEYFLAVKQNLPGYKVGAYGNYGVIGHLKSTGHVDYYCQTLAWSGGKRQSFLHIYQAQCDTKLGGLPVDIDILERSDVGAWGTPNPVAKPSPTSVPVKRNGKLQVLTDNLNIRNIPSTNGSVLGQVHNGDVLDFYYTQDGWYCITTTEDKWIYSANGSYLKEVVNAPAPAKPKPAPKTTSGVIIGQVRVIVDNLNIRDEPSTNGTIIGTATKGTIYNVVSNVNDWHEIIVSNNHQGFVFGNNGQYLELVKPSAPAPAKPAAVYHTVVSGETLSGIATKFGTTVAALEKLNAISNPDLISIGQKLRVK